MKKPYRQAKIWYADQFQLETASALCADFNKGRDPHHQQTCIFNGSVIYVVVPDGVLQTAQPGAWIVADPVGDITVLADIDFNLSYIRA